MDTSILKRGIITKVITGEDFSLPEFVNQIQDFCLGLRITHWETNCFALHKASEEIQSSLEDLMDSFVESFVGMNEGKRPSFSGNVSKVVDPDKLIGYLKGISVKDTSLLNIRDEMLQSLYKFKYLKTLS